MATEFNVPEAQQNVVDLRSDTVTRPDRQMYDAILSAPLGDDVLGDEPTVQRLETLACERTGKDAAVFVPSGTMGNQIALPSHTERGDAVIFEEEAHMLYYECGGPGVLGQVVTWTLPSKLGVMDPEDVERHITKRSLHTPGVRLICVENTHNRAGGTVVPISAMRAYREMADRHGVAIHLDGARLFNASVALGVPATEITQYVDSVSICLSKGLGSPVGSVLCGGVEFIDRARQWRKRLGGAMRQAGILAACGIVSLTDRIGRLEEDHRRARAMASAIAELPGIRVDWDRVQTNMVLVWVKNAAEWSSRLKEQGVWCLPVAENRLRLVFHSDIDDSKLDVAVEGFKSVAGAKTAAGA